MSFLRRSYGTLRVNLGDDLTLIAGDAISPYSASATYQIDASTGTYTATTVGSITQTTRNRWLNRGDGSVYYVRATLVSGDTPTGTLNSWLKTDTNRSWSISGSGSGISFFGTIKIEISNQSDGSIILDSHQVTFDVTTGGGG